MTDIDTQLNSKDIQIIKMLESHYKISTEKISEKLDIPARSIRYRISRLKEKGILSKRLAITHERKLGLREQFIYINEIPSKKCHLLEIFDANPAFWYVPTTGKYNGFLLHALDPISPLNLPKKIMQDLKKEHLLQDYFIYETIDFLTLGWDFTYFDSLGNWNWEWQIWSDLIQRAKTDADNRFTFDDALEIITFDQKDIQILNNLYSEEEIPIRKIAESLDLSESQIGRRIKTMQQKGIIKGYRSGFNPFRDLIGIDCFIYPTGSFNRIINLLAKIPYPKSVTFASQQLAVFSVFIPNNEVKDFLNAFDTLKPLLDSYFLQFWHSVPSIDHQDLYEFYETTTNSWSKLTKGYELANLKLKEIITENR
ncbi:MAG: winged helix-turn-helix transcriptional regulator [Candidatus Heimdallarchaeota archaeon]